MSDSLFSNMENLKKMEITKNSMEYLPIGIEESLLKILLRYQVLTKDLFLKGIQTKNPAEWKEKNLPSALKHLRQNGFLILYAQDKPAPLGIYFLTEKAKKYLEQKEYKRHQGKEWLPEDFLKEPEKLRQYLSLNQWHINLLYLLKDRVKQGHYETLHFSKKYVIPSHVSYEITIEKKWQTIHLFALPAPREEEAFTEFTSMLLAGYAFLTAQKQYRPAFFIILCESKTHMAWICMKIHQLPELQLFDGFLYAIDMITCREKMLSLLYCCQGEEESLTRTTLCLS